MNLFQNFPTRSKADWIARATKDLKGKPLQDLHYTSADGLNIAPFYTAEDTANHNTSPLFTHKSWTITHPETADAVNLPAQNKRILEALNTGATGLFLEIKNADELEKLLVGVSVSDIGLQILLSGNENNETEKVATFLENKAAKIETTFLLKNPFRKLLNGEAPDVDETTFQQFSETKNPFKALLIDVSTFLEAGATPGYQLANALTMLSDCLAKQNQSEAKSKVVFHFAIGPDFFFEIAKLRALRLLIPLLEKAYNTKLELSLHCSSALRYLAIPDVANNILRSSTEAMAAVLGGCNSLFLHPYTAPLQQENTDEAARLSRNIQLILQHESHFDACGDVAAGSYYVETITRHLADAAWQDFQETETNGGWLAAWKSGEILRKTEAMDAAEKQRFADGKIILTGVNKYAAPLEGKAEIPANSSEVESQFPALKISRLAAEKELEMKQQEA